MIGRRLVLAALLVLLLLLCACTPETADSTGDPTKAENVETVKPIETVTGRFEDDPEAMERVIGSVVKLETYDDKGQRINTGSGFCAFDPSILITAALCIVSYFAFR